MAIVHKLFLGNDIDFELPSLQYRSDESHITNATVTAQLYEAADFAWDPDTGAIDADAVEVGDPFTLSYVAGSDSRYVGTLQAGVGLTENAYYKMVVTVTSGTRDAVFIMDCQAIFRQPTDK